MKKDVQVVLQNGKLEVVFTYSYGGDPLIFAEIYFYEGFFYIITKTKEAIVGKFQTLEEAKADVRSHIEETLYND